METKDRFLTCAAGLKTEEPKVNNKEGFSVLLSACSVIIVTR